MNFLLYDELMILTKKVILEEVKKMIKISPLDKSAAVPPLSI